VELPILHLPRKAIRREKKEPFTGKIWRKRISRRGTNERGRGSNLQSRGSRCSSLIYPKGKKNPLLREGGQPMERKKTCGGERIREYSNEACNDVQKRKGEATQEKGSVITSSVRKIRPHGKGSNRRP